MTKFRPHQGTRTVFVTIGLPASGKSSWAIDLQTKEPGRFKRVNKDLLRTLLDNGQWSPDNEGLIQEASVQLINMALDSGHDVIVDNTHLTKRSINLLHKLASDRGDVLLIEKVFPTPVDECIRRNVLRMGTARVPDKVIHDMARSAGIDKYGYRDLRDKETYYESRGSSSPRESDHTLPKAIICDLDGTLALIGDRSPYDASECDVRDRPNVPVVETVKALWYQGHHVIFLSGRNEKYREATERFIEKHVQVKFPSNWMIQKGVIPHELFMRANDDMRKDSIVKRELFERHVDGKYDVLLVVDDRQSVTAMWRNELGLTTFQVDWGRF